MGRRRAYGVLAAGAAALACLLAAGPSAAQGRTLEYPVKAAFLSKFGAFTDWPAGTLDQADTLRICVVGVDPFGPALDRTAQSQTVAGRPVTVVRLPAVDRSSGCHILYASGSSRQSAAQALAAVRGRPVLTVTDASRTRARGMIHFVVYDDRVRFYADLQQAQASGVGLSSKLLALALTVKR